MFINLRFYFLYFRLSFNKKFFSKLNQFDVKVSIRLRSSVLDPAGEAIKSAANKLGVESINSLRIGKLIEIKIEGVDENDVESKIELLCDRLFANKVIEDYEYTLRKIDE